MTLELCQSYYFAVCLLPGFPEIFAQIAAPCVWMHSDLLRFFAACSAPAFTDRFALSARGGIHSYLFNLGLVFFLSDCNKHGPACPPWCTDSLTSKACSSLILFLGLSQPLIKHYLVMQIMPFLFLELVKYDSISWFQITCSILELVALCWSKQSQGNIFNNPFMIYHSL